MMKTMKTSSTASWWVIRTCRQATTRIPVATYMWIILLQDDISEPVWPQITSQMYGGTGTQTEFTFDKMQRRNHTKARIDYFLLSRNTTELLTGASIGRACKLSDHRPIYFQISSSTFKKGRGFWRFDNDLLKTMDFIAGCNRVIADTMKSYSNILKNIDNPGFQK